MRKFSIKAFALLCLLVAVPAFAETVMTPAAGPVPYFDCDYRTAICLEDDFASGGTTSGTVGRLGWVFAGGAVAYQAGESNEAGIARRNTTASSGVTSYMMPQVIQDVFAAGSMDVLWKARLNTNDVNTTARIGAAYIINASPTNGQYFEKLDGDTNWFCVTRAAGAQTRTDSGIAVDTNPHLFLVSRVSSTVVRFLLDGVQVCSHATHIPSQALTPANHIVNSTTADKTLDLMHFKLRYPVSR